jgi:predicted ester cyclase
MYRTACPDLQCTVEEVMAEGDKVALRWVSRGTHQGDLMGIAPTGKQVTFRGIQMQRISQGKIEEEWAGFNTLGVLQEIGAVPRLGQPAAAGR